MGFRESNRLASGVGLGYVRTDISDRTDLHAVWLHHQDRRRPRWLTGTLRHRAAAAGQLQVAWQQTEANVIGRPSAGGG